MSEPVYLTPHPDAPFHWDHDLEPAPEPTLHPAPSLGDDNFTLHTTTALELCEQPEPERQELLGPLIQHAGRTIIVGDTGEGKTTIALQMIRHTLEGTLFLDHYQGAGEGRALIIDLEQGVRSVRRSLTDAHLHTRDDVHLALIPDGLALDRDPQHLQELDRVIGQNHYSIVCLDPYYKAHQADEPNAERPIIDLMRKLDALRARHQFALILPAHPRKEAVGSSGPRRLTIHDISGSGAITRGAEIVIAIERVAQGYARLRYLKDRDTDLPIGQAWHLLYNRQDGYTRDPKDTEPDRDYAHELRDADDGQWRTLKEWRDLIKAAETTIKSALDQLVADGEYELQVGPPGRHPKARCYRHRCASSPPMHPDAQDALPGVEGVGACVHPPSIRDGDAMHHTYPTASASTNPDAPQAETDPNDPGPQQPEGGDVDNDIPL